MKDNNLHQPDPLEGYERSSHIRHGVGWFLGALTAVLTGDAAIFMGWIPVTVIFYTAFLACVVMIIREFRRQDRIEYKNYCRIRSAISNVDAEINKIYTNLDLKEDKPAFKMEKPVHANVRPGSRVSEQYKALVGGEVLDNRRKNPEFPSGS